MSQRSNGRFANKNAEADNCHSYESVEEAAKDLGLMAPEDVSPITVSAFEQIDQITNYLYTNKQPGLHQLQHNVWLCRFLWTCSSVLPPRQPAQEMDVDTYRNDQQQRVIYFKNSRNSQLVQWQHSMVLSRGPFRLILQKGKRTVSLQ